jgi:4,5:9,10-diseco-3-hydroxy-5,9,17-trioxoandrosta-1(10),2-diene-4-oate hydrolase
MDYQHNRVGQYATIGKGLRVHYHERGKGEPVVFLHGGGQGSGGWTNWKLNLDHFAQAGFRAIAPDALGYGLSDKPTDAEYSLEFLAGTLREFLDALGLKAVVLVGNSMGGATAIKFTQEWPDRVRKLVVMAPAAIGPMERYRDMPAIRMLFELGREPGGITKDKLRRLLTALSYNADLVDEEMLSERLEVAVTQPKEVFQTMRMNDLAPRLPEIKIPVFALWGREDQACPVANGMEILNACENARFLAFPKCGHWVQAEKAQAFNAVCVDFLRE